MAGDSGSVSQQSIRMVISAFVAVAWHNVIALNIIIWFIFKRWTGLYFYMLLIASWGILLHQLGFLLLFFGIVEWFAEAFVVLSIGWYAMVTGQSLVLYLRLHLVREPQKIRWVLYMIIANAICFHIPTTVFFVMNHNNPQLQNSYTIWENVQVTVFSIQEVIIASLYIYGTRKCLQPSEQFQKMKFRQVMRHLVYASVFVILMDIAVICVQYANLFQIQVVFKGAVYSVKLFVEFFVLNRLRDAVGSGVSSSAPRNGGYVSSRRSTTTIGRGGIAGRQSVALTTFDTDGDREVLVPSQISMEKGKTGAVIVADRNVPLPPETDRIHVTSTMECRTSRSTSHQTPSGESETETDINL